MRTAWTTSTRSAVALLAAAAGLAIGGCGGGPADLMTPAAQRATSAASEPGSSASPAEPSISTLLAPLTGLPATGARAAGRPAVAVPLSGDQLQGLGSADVVFEEMTSPLRYIAVFQSRNDGSVGPVGQTRPTDGQVLSVLHPLIAYDGGTPSFVKVLDRTQVVDVGSARYPVLYRTGAHGPTISTSDIRRAARGTAPPQLFTYQGPGIGEEEGFASTGSWRSSSLKITAPGQATQAWAFSARGHRWRLVSGGPSVLAANIVVQKVPYKTVFLSHKYGFTTTSARVIGSGPALMLSETGPADRSTGVAVNGTWSKPGIRAVTDYLDADNHPVGFRQGATWVILAPPGTQVSTAGSRP
jgi:Protein of unknown function (DUF3048) N-terminal domain/Protein of unknown function (DUF3048) C-terminal domain